MLRRDIYRIGFPKTFTILDDADNESIAKQVLQLHGMDRTKKTVRELLNRVAHFKSVVCPDYIGRYMLQTSPRFTDTSGMTEVESFLHYQALNYALEFDDIITFTLYLFDNFAEVRRYWQETLDYVMVDEVQDCNASDWRILDVITALHGNLFIVGDPDQAIYEWRGARPAAFVAWQPDTEVILARNYRSTPEILDVANSIIRHNRMRIDKDLVTMRLPHVKAHYYHAPNDQKEAAWIARTLQRLQAEGEDPGNCAVLYRASYMSRALEQEFIKRKIPYVIWGSVRFFERKEIKDALAYLRLVAVNDNLAFRRVVNTPPRHFGDTSMQRLQQLQRDEQRPLFEVLKDNLDLWRKTRAYPHLCAFIHLIEKCRREQEHMAVSEILNFILKDTGLTESYRDDQKEERLENVEELIHSIRSYENAHRNDDITLARYLQDVALFTNADYKDDGGKVKLMTIHQSKGLEFPVVVVCGLSEGLFPSHRTMRERRLAGLEEERRLMYVAVTRAERRLFLTEAEGYNIQSRADKYPSRFLTEIPPSQLTTEGRIDPTLLDAARSLVRAIDIETGITPGDSVAPADPADGAVPLFKVGMRVRHKFLGEGVITDLSADGDRAKVRFGDDAATERNLLTRVLTPLPEN